MVPQKHTSTLFREFFRRSSRKSFLWSHRLRESLLFRLGRGSRETLVRRKPRKLALTRDTNPSRCRTSLGKILFISSSRRQLNDRNSSAEPLSPFFRHFIPSFALRISNSLDPRGGISILLGDNSEIVPDSSSRRAKPLWEETRELPSFRLTFHGTILARACGKVRSRV